MVASAVLAPLTLAVHRLAAAALRALLELVGMRTSIAIVQSDLSNAIQSAALILMIFLLVVASVIDAPSTNTVHRLGTLLSGALLKTF